MEAVKWDSASLGDDWLEKLNADIPVARARPYGNSIVEEIVKDICICLHLKQKVGKIKDFLED